jgi:hypothetical protein
MYTCDWPSSGGVCGRQAFWFIDAGGYHRPLCQDHASRRSEDEVLSEGAARGIEEINGSKVPQKIPTQTERAKLDGRNVAERARAIDAAGRIKMEPERWTVRDGVPVVEAVEAPAFKWPSPPEPPTPPEPPQPPSVASPLSRPPLKEALADVAVAFLGFLKKEIEGYKR